MNIQHLLKDQNLMASLACTDVSTLESLLPPAPAPGKSDVIRSEARSYISTISTNFKLEPINGAQAHLINQLGQ